MILPGTIPETPISHEWSWRLERPWGSFQPGERLAGGFVNSARRIHRVKQIIERYIIVNTH